VHGVTY